MSIAGIISAKGRDAKALIRVMASPLRHTELAKVEPWTDDDAGLCRVHSGAVNTETQPLFTPDGSLCIIMSGECFGYEEDRKQLQSKGHIFRFNNNDAEFCLNLYAEKGVEGFRRLNGSFSIAIFNTRSREIILISDRFASRPLFYVCTPAGTLLFSSQVSSILQMPDVPRDLDLHAVFELIATQAVPGTRTLNKAVHMLPPASILRFKNGRLTLGTYWEGNYSPEEQSEKRWAEELAEAIRTAVRRVTHGPHRFGLLLSGGMDSRMVLAAAEKEVTCYTFGDYQNDEYLAARRVAETKGFPSVFIQRPSHHYAKLARPAVEIGSGMYAFNHAHAVGFLDALRKDCDVMLHGLATEPYFRDTKLPTVEKSLLGIKVRKVLNTRLKDADLPARLFWRHFTLLHLRPHQLFTNAYAARLDSALQETAEELLNEAERHCTAIHEKFGWPETHYFSKNPPFLFSLSMRPYITERNFVCDNNLLDLHFRMPAEIRLDSRIWIKAMNILDPKVATRPDANTGFKMGQSPILTSLFGGIRSALDIERFIPAALPGGWRLRRMLSGQQGEGRAPAASRISYPFFPALIRTDEQLRSLIADTINDPACLNPDIFDIDRIQEIYREHMEDHIDHRYFLFILLTFGLWHKKYGPLPTATASSVS